MTGRFNIYKQRVLCYLSQNGGSERHYTLGRRSMSGIQPKDRNRILGRLRRQGYIRKRKMRRNSAGPPWIVWHITDEGRKNIEDSGCQDTIRVA